jgi:uncharacterized protein involved in exopolysaccharide biosynthesis
MNVSANSLLVVPEEAVRHHAEADSFDVRAAFHAVGFAIRSRTRMILQTTVVAVALVALYIAVWPPVYQTKVTVVSATDKDLKREQFYADWAVFRRDDLNNEVQMFTSGPVMTRVIKRLDLHYDDVYHPPLSYLSHLWQVSPPGKLWRWIKDLISPPGPDAPTPAEADFAATLEDLKSGVALLPVGDSTVGELTVRGPSPKVREIANTVFDVYMEQRRERFAQEAEEAYRSLKTESDRARAALLANERQMQQYFTQNDMQLMFEKDKVNISQLLTQRSSIVDIETQIQQATGELAVIRRQMRGEPSEIVAARTVQPNNIHAGIVDKIAQIELARRVALIHYLPTSPEVAEMDRQLAALRTQLAMVPTEMVQQTSLARSPARDGLAQRAAGLVAQIAGARSALEVKRRNAAELKTSVDEIPQKMKESHDLGREHDLLEKKYMALEDKLMVAEVSRATARSAPPSIAIIERAGRPDKPTMPKTKLFLICAVLIGLLAGTLLAVIVNTLQGLVSRVTLGNRRNGARLYGIVEQEPGHADRVFGL